MWSINKKFLLTVAVCFLWSAVADAQRPVVYAVNYPLQYFAQRIAGDHAEIIMPVPRDADPAFWQPDTKTVGEFQRADLILLNGAGYAKWVGRASLPRRKLVDTSASFRDRYIESTEGTSHSHGREGKHSHAGTAFTTWLDFSQAAEQAKSVRDTLTRLIPSQREAFENNFSALEHELLDLDAKLKSIAMQRPGKPVLASHPVYQYLARRYALNLKSVMWEPDKAVTQEELQSLAQLRALHPGEWMIWENDPVSDNVQRLKGLGIGSTVFNPCANKPDSGDFLSVMRKNIKNMDELFSR